MTVPFAIAEASSPAEMSDCLAVRHAVFCVEQGISVDDERDGRDGAARHLLARIGEEPVGAMRLRVIGEAAKLERICVLRDRRRLGIGSALTKEALRLAASMPGVALAKLGAQTPAIAFYEKLGFVAEGPEYLDAGLPHRDMTLPLDARPPS